MGELGIDDYIRFIAALIFVIGLIMLVSHLAKRFGLPGVMSGGRALGGLAGMAPSRRLSMIEVMALDSRRRLVLVKRDDTEHLLLLGAGADLVVEPGITPKPPVREIRPAAHGEAQSQ